MVVMKNNFILLLCLVAGLFSVTRVRVNGQFSITAYPPPPEFTFDDLWHFTASGPTSTNFTDYYVALRIFDDKGAVLLKSNSAVFPMTSGTLYIDKTNMQGISPFTTLYYASLYQQVVNNGEFFPVGSYHIFFSLMGRPTDGEYSELAEASYTVAVELFMPPILIYPEDEDTIDNPYPVLTWLPAFQAANGQEFLYTLRLVELYTGQTSQQAITANPAYMEQENLPMTALPYPPGGNNLQLNHTYVWQVTATMNGAPAGYSQIWRFTYALPTPVFDSLVRREQFYTLFAEKDGAVVPIKEDHVPVKIEEVYLNADEQLSFRIYNSRNEIIATSNNVTIEITHGIRFAKIPICGNPIHLEYNQVYLIETINAKGQSKFLRIRNQFDPINCE